MGWKAFKDHFKVKHIVRIEDGTLYISSSYLPRLVPISMDTGKILRGDDSDNPINFLKKYYPEIAEASSELIKSLLDQEDVFERSIEVYTFDYSTYDILTKYCEVFGHPNVTHDGCLMCENEHYLSRDEAVNRAKESLASVIKWRTERVNTLEAELSQAKAKLEFLKRKVIT